MFDFDGSRKQGGIKSEGQSTFTSDNSLAQGKKFGSVNKLLAAMGENVFDLCSFYILQ